MHQAKRILFLSFFLALFISSPLFSGFDNSPGQYLVLPEAIWAPAGGGGTWVTEAQITDLTGGSEVRVQFYYGGGSYRGGTSGFLLWTGSGINSSVKFANILSQIDSLDSGSFTYYGKVGALLFETQDSTHKIHVAARTFNGNYSKTLQSVNPVVYSSVALVGGPSMIIHNLTSNSSYRSTAGFFNPTQSSVTADFSLIGSDGAVIGSTFSKTFVAYDYKAFYPFTEAGIPYPGISYDNAYLRVTPTSGSGGLIGFGATANNVTNDPAAHTTFWQGGDYLNSADDIVYIPEAIWAAASYGGTWVTDVQITDVTGGSPIHVSFSYENSGAIRGSFLLWTGGNPGSSTKIENILSAMDDLDSAAGFSYYGRVGTLRFGTTSGRKILVSTRTHNGNYSKTFPGLRHFNANHAYGTRPMIIQNLSSNVNFRATVGLYPYLAGKVEVRLYSSTGAQIGSTYTFDIEGFLAFDPFAQAGVPYPANSYDNVMMKIDPPPYVEGGATVYCFGATANNSSNDPAAHIAVHGLDE